MSIRVMSCVPMVCAGLLATPIMLGTSRATFAADDCLAGPTRPPAQGGHWYYRLDRVNNRKCWYLVEPEARAPTVEAPQPQPSPEPAPQPSFSTFFSSLSAGFAGATSTTQPDTTGDPRIVQTSRPDDPRSDEAVAGQPRVARHADQEAANATKPRRPARPHPSAERADEGAATPPNQAERDVLFQEFLRWRERQAP